MERMVNLYLSNILDWTNKILGQAWHCTGNTGGQACSVPCLCDVHIPLSTRDRVAVCEDDNGCRHRILPSEVETKGLEIGKDWQILPMPAIETIAHYSRVLLVGGAGSGKTTTLCYLAYQSASLLQPAPVIWLFTSNIGLSLGEHAPLANWFKTVFLAYITSETRDTLIHVWWSALRRTAPEDDSLAALGAIWTAIDRFDVTRLAFSPGIISHLVTLQVHGEETWLTREQSLYQTIFQVIMARWSPDAVHQIQTCGTGPDKGEPAEQNAPLSVAARTACTALAACSVAGEPFPSAILQNSLHACLPSWNPAVRESLHHFLESESGLLERMPGGELVFSSRSLQAFLAATVLHGHHDLLALAATLSRTTETHWHQAFILAVGLVAPETGIAAVQTLCPPLPPAEAVDDVTWHAAWTAGTALAGMEACPARQAILDRIRQWLVRLVEQGALSVQDRHAVGMVLSRLGGGGSPVRCV